VGEQVASQRALLDTELKPPLDAAVAGPGPVLFVDAAHFVSGTFRCCLGSVRRVFVRAARGRQRFNVLGAWDAVTRAFVSVTNTTVVNTDTMCELLRKIASAGLVGPVTVVLDTARYQRNQSVQALAAELSITLLDLPSYAPNRNLIERLWRFLRRRSVDGKYHPNFAAFRTALETTIGQLPTTYAGQLASLMTLNFQEFNDVSLLTA
jgi:transposase